MEYSPIFMKTEVSKIRQPIISRMNKKIILSERLRKLKSTELNRFEFLGLLWPLLGVTIVKDPFSRNSSLIHPNPMPGKILNGR